MDANAATSELQERWSRAWEKPGAPYGAMSLASVGAHAVFASLRPRQSARDGLEEVPPVRVEATFDDGYFHDIVSYGEAIKHNAPGSVPVTMLYLLSMRSFATAVLRARLRVFGLVHREFSAFRAPDQADRLPDHSRTVLTAERVNDRLTLTEVTHWQRRGSFHALSSNSYVLPQRSAEPRVSKRVDEELDDGLRLAEPLCATPAQIRKYAWLSRDLNPLHLSRAVARRSGFAGLPAHGMWVAGRMLSMLEGHHGAVINNFSVAFRRPLIADSSASVLASVPARSGLSYLIETKNGRIIARAEYTYDPRESSKVDAKGSPLQFGQRPDKQYNF